jgi:hypothetical protein
VKTFEAYQGSHHTVGVALFKFLAKQGCVIDFSSVFLSPQKNLFFLS